MSVRRRDLPHHPEGQKIVKVLDRVVTATGTSPGDVFEDWLEICEATLAMAPLHARSVAQTGQMAEDPASIKALWKRIEDRYSHYKKSEMVFKAFQEALVLLMQAVVDVEGNLDYDDVLGDCYMAWGYPSASLGQFFTPSVIARAMARMLYGDEAGRANECIEHLTAGYKKSPPGILHMQLLGEGGDERVDKFVADNPLAVLPLCARYVEPIRIQDPTCGAGVMLLAAAEQFPQWALQSGLVQLYGIDLDITCVRMCRINLMIRGLSPIYIQHGNSLSGELMSPLPEPFYQWYPAVESASVDTVSVEPVSQETELSQAEQGAKSVGVFEYQQASLFENAEVQNLSKT